MNIKVAAFTVSEKSSNIHIRLPNQVSIRLLVDNAWLFICFFFQTCFPSLPGQYKAAGAKHYGHSFKSYISFIRMYETH